MKTCPECRGEGCPKCDHSGFDLERAKNQCPYCGAPRNFEVDEKCSKCGKPLKVDL